ncbi:MAG TPA: hypothetical protein VEV63_20085 [Streptosporangiaceae bacterium]|nr:hypothetical protein [Streptosporangiaceae bacterium]
MRKILYGALTAVVVIGGCGAVSHLPALQSQQIPESARLTVPENVAIRPPAFQRGIDVDAYTYPEQDFSYAAATVVAYVKKLHANSLSISFPFFMSNRQSSTVFASPRTPTPTELGLFIADAERAGLYVSIRPLLTEYQIGGDRTTFRPVHMSAWFASYRRFLLPYARMAQTAKVGTFIVGAEFSNFGRAPLWNRLDRALKKVFHGRLAYSNNGTMHLSESTGGRFTTKAVDAYPSMNRYLRHGWMAFDRKLPRGTIISELGISAFKGAWRTPWAHKPTTKPLDPRVQVRWFRAACHAAKANRLGGIYFWALPLGATFPRTTAATPGAWAYSVGAVTIARCFGRAK